MWQAFWEFHGCYVGRELISSPSLLFLKDTFLG
jgi:hypothetical protein